MKVIFLIITLFLLLVIAVRTVMSLRYNFKLSNNYSHNPEAYNYKEALEGRVINLSNVEDLFSSIVAPLGYNLTNVVSTPVKIHYYYAIGDQSPAYIIDKGKRIFVKKDSNSLSVEVGYGLDSLPTDVAGWRIAYPFATDTGISNELLYVRMDELFNVARSWVIANEAHVKEGYQLWLTRSNRIRLSTLCVDRRLYNSGVYLSPDLFVPIFSVSSLIMSMMSIFTFVAWVFIRGANTTTKNANSS